MKVFLSPSVGLYSPAMARIANALTKYLPPHHEIVNQIEQADLCIFYPIGYDWTKHLAECIAQGKEYALIQCCYKSSGGTFDMWHPWWEKAIVVWSYLDLLPEADTHGSLNACAVASQDVDFNYYEAPLGIDEAFTLPLVAHPKRDYIVTTGTMHGVGCEAILECWQAALKCNLSVVHVGPYPVGIDKPNVDVSGDEWGTGSITGITGVTDQTLRGIYQNARWTCSLRYVEGFELPALESLSCGTRSIVFTQPATTKWFFDYCDFVPESEGEELVNYLVRKFSGPYEPVSQSTVDEVRSRFNWGVLAWRFWSIVEKEMSMRRQVKRAIV